MPDMNAFQQMVNNPNAMNMLNPGGFPNMPPNPFGFAVPNFPPPPMMGFPLQNQNPMIPNNPNNMIRGDFSRAGPNTNTVPLGRGAGPMRDFGDRDHRRQFRDDRDQDNRQRGGYDNRGRTRDYRSRDHGRDRDRRSPSPNRRRRDDRDRDRHSRDESERDRDYRSSRNRSGNISTIISDLIIYLFRGE
jgi:hypothetical protein